MATINWLTGVISVPKTDLTLVQSIPTEIYNLDLNAFRLELRDHEDDLDGRPWTKTHKHNTEVTLSGLTFARVLEIIPPYTVTFEDGQYAVNLIGANSNVADRTNVNQVSVRPQNSAGLITTIAIENGEFESKVTINSESGNTGTVYPTGTQRKAVNNVPDAVAIAVFRGFDELFFQNSLVISTGDNVINYNLTGRHKSQVVLNFLPDALTDGAIIRNATVQGTLDGDSVLDDCIVGTLNYVNGVLRHCKLQPGTIFLDGGLQASFMYCASDVPGEDTPTIDMGGSGQSMIMRSYDGGIRLINKTGPEAVSIDLNSGQVRLDPVTVTAGKIVVRGNGKLVDDVTGEYIYTGVWNGVIIVNEANTPQSVADAVWRDTILYEETSKGGLMHHLRHLEYTVFLNTSALTDGDGSQHEPFKLEGSAVDYAETHGILSLNLLDDVDFTRQIKNFLVTSTNIVTVDFGNNNINGSRFNYLKLKGMYTGFITAQHCNLFGITNLNGFFDNCALGGTFEVPDGGSALMQDTSSLEASSLTPPSISIGGVAGTGILDVRGHKGGFVISNCNQVSDFIKIVLHGGTVVFDASCTNGSVRLTGFGTIINNSTIVDFDDQVIDPRKLNETHEVLGLSVDSPVTIGNGKYLSNNINIDVTDNGNGTYELDRV